ncbi:PHP domain-containing protein [Acetonema longum]|uniref:PHP domain protein n=1 Tax=Acetonema longum DSM 6540 TaxID=1009370 RepID=F7NPD7_9FIRM|nr:PHP domain-containing protein [Acetonema longum]EGO62099.1 PHP domain protein [Acetonema longum DSM 6540]
MSIEKADLHIHTTASDGLYTPQEIIDSALQAGLSHISITDHDTLDGLLSLNADSHVQKLKVIPGIEFSTDLPAHEVHILGYYIDIRSKPLRQQLDVLTEDRRLRVNKILEKLALLGYPISQEQVLRTAMGATSVGRPHVAKVLVERGYFSSVAEVFSQILSAGKPAYVPHFKLTPEQVIRLIIQAKGVPVLAHPGLIGNDALVSAIIQKGIRGLEVYHPMHSKGEIAKYLSLARQHNLLVTGGSDFHGIPARYPASLGQFYIPADVVYQLQTYRE